MKYLILAVSICFAFLSCKKDDSSSNNQTKIELITNGSWKYESGGADINKDGSIDVSLESTGQAPACILDNSATFNANGTGINDEGATKCDDALPQTTTFTWAFVNNQTAINVAGSAFAGLSGQFKIVALTDTKFTISKDTTVMNIPGTLIVNLKH